MSRKPSNWAKAGEELGGGLRGYLVETRGLALSFLFIAPLVALYEVGLILVQPRASSWASGLIRRLLVALLGEHGLLGFNVLVLVGVLGAFWWLNHHKRVHVRYYPWVLVESGVYALFFGGVVLWLLQVIPLPLGSGGIRRLADGLVLSIGAGVYEEIVFRLLLLNGVYSLVRSGWGGSPVVSGFVAVLASAVIFSLCHHFAEPFAWRAFSFRCISGAIFGVVFLSRGLAVATYTHTFYDVLVTLEQW
jgi:membrane protease YdiL (CAAX protease family)